MSKRERERKEKLSLIRELITNEMAEIFLLIHSAGFQKGTICDEIVGVRFEIRRGERGEG